MAIVVVANLLCYLLNSGSVLWRGRSCTHVDLVLVSNRRQGVPREQRPKTWFAWDLIDSKHVVRVYRQQQQNVLACWLAMLAVPPPQPHSSAW